MCVADKFIMLWLGEKYIINQGIVLLLAVMFYVSNLGAALKSYMSIKGYFKTDKTIVIISAIINISLSLILVQSIGLSGV